MDLINGNRTGKVKNKAQKIQGYAFKLIFQVSETPNPL